MNGTPYKTAVDHFNPNHKIKTNEYVQKITKIFGLGPYNLVV